MCTGFSCFSLTFWPEHLGCKLSVCCYSNLPAAQLLRCHEYKPFRLNIWILLDQRNAEHRFHFPEWVFLPFFVPVNQNVVLLLDWKHFGKWCGAARASLPVPFSIKSRSADVLRPWQERRPEPGEWGHVRLLAGCSASLPPALCAFIALSIQSEQWSTQAY